jgi:hypothetical protein
VDTAAARCFLASHHMSVSAGRHQRDTRQPVYQERVRRIEEAGRIGAWLSGHDNEHRSPLYCCEALGQGRCEPVVCPKE